MVNVASDGWECWRLDDIISFVCTCWKWFQEKKKPSGYHAQAQLFLRFYYHV